MVEATITIKLNTSEYRFLRNELEMLRDELKDSQKGMRAGKERQGLQRREAQLHFMLEKI